MKKFSYKIFLRTSHLNKNGSHTVFLRVTHNRKSKFFSLNITVFLKDWSEKSVSVKKSDVEYIRKNKYLRMYEKKVKDIKDNYFFNNKVLTINQFTQLFKNENFNKTDLDSFIKDELKVRILKDSTKQTYLTQLSKINQFKKEIKIEKIDFNFILEYESYMKKRGNNPNTISKTMSILKRFLNWAIQRDILEKNPFKNYKIKKYQGNREFLTISEVNILENLLISDKISKRKKEILSHFLFSCYTGLRYSDMIDLRYKNFKTDIYKDKKHLKILIDMHKTGKPVSIPMISKSKKFLKNDFLPNEKVFKIRTNQVTNKRLKEIMKIAGIDKNISFHCARHTFATCAIDLDIKLEVVSKILGHTDLKTTLIYAKIRDERKAIEMQKFE